MLQRFGGSAAMKRWGHCFQLPTDPMRENILKITDPEFEDVLKDRDLFDVNAMSNLLGQEFLNKLVKVANDGSAFGTSRERDSNYRVIIYSYIVPEVLWLWSVLDFNYYLYHLFRTATWE